MATRRTSTCESLESRRLLSAAPQAVLDAGFVPMEWRGQQVYAKPGQWLLQLKGMEGAADAQLAKANQQLGKLNAAFKATKHLGRDGLLLVDVPKELGHGKLKDAFGRLANFGYMEPDGALWSAEISNDPSAGSLWGLNNTGQTGGTPDADIDAPEAWDVYGTGNGSVVVGVIDSGIDYAHPDLAANMWTNIGEIAGNRKDDDLNGYVDDVRGWDFVNNDNNPADDYGHGTHVAGTIAAAGNNGVGVVGVNWNAKLMALKAQGATGTGPWSAAVAAVNYATMMKTRYAVNIDVTNNSYGGISFSQSLYDAVKANGEAGMLFVGAAGNDNTSWPSYPAGFDLENIISVAATDYNDAFASFSNRSVTAVDLAAPGVNILSTLPGGTYGAKNGTSMASPHVAGVAALAWAIDPDVSAARVRAAILTGVEAKPSLDGKVFTRGRLNADNTLAKLNAVYTTPDALTGLTATAATAQPVIQLAWTHNATAGQLEGYKVYRSTEGGPFVRVVTVPAGSTGYSDSGLVSGTAYTYRVTASNYLVESTQSDEAGAITAGVKPSTPYAPSSLTATAVSRTQVNLAWVDGSGNEDGFRIERSTDGNAWSQVGTVGANITSFANGGLKRNTVYHYRVAAYNALGQSPYSIAASAKTLAAGQFGTSALAAGTFSDTPMVPLAPRLDAAEDDALAAGWDGELAALLG